MKNNDITHSDLVLKAAKWLKKHTENITIPNCSLVLKEMIAESAWGENPDVLGFSSTFSVVVEVKTSRSDFLADKKKFVREYPDTGMGQLRLFCCPEGLITGCDIHGEWGLLYWTGKKIKLIKPPILQESNLKAERSYLLSVIRRMKTEKWDGKYEE